MQTITQRLDVYPSFLAPLKEAASRYAKYDSTVTDDGEMRIGRRPWVAELNYMLTLYPGLPDEAIGRYSQRFGIKIPDLYTRLLRSIGGAFCFGISLCGIPPSMLGDPPLLDRKSLQCHDLATSVSLWAREYRVPARYFHFGSRHFSYTENVGYFIVDQTRLLSIRKGGEIVAEWRSFTNFLSDELQASERLEEELHPSKWSTT